MEKEYSYLKLFQRLFQEQNRMTAFDINKPEELLLWKSKLKDKLNELLGMEKLKALGFSCRGKNIKAEELEEVKEDGYLRKKFRMETLPDVYMPFYMMIPDNLEEGKKLKAMLAIPAHGANKDTVAGVISNEEVKKKLERSPKESYGREFVKRGYAVFCPDPPGYGERIERIAREDRAFLPEIQESVLGSSCKNLAQTAEAFGLSFQGLVLWDMMCLVDFAAGQPWIDEKSIGCAGFSGGGLYTLWLAAMDERIKLSVISGYIHGYYDSILNTHLCPCNYLPKLWQYADISDIASLIAPRYLYMENGYGDVLNGPRGILDPKEQAEKIRKVYDLYGKQERMVHLTFDGIHEWYGGCYDFVNEYL